MQCTRKDGEEEQEVLVRDFYSLLKIISLEIIFQSEVNNFWIIFLRGIFCRRRRCRRHVGKFMKKNFRHFRKDEKDRISVGLYAGCFPKGV